MPTSSREARSQVQEPRRRGRRGRAILFLALSVPAFVIGIGLLQQGRPVAVTRPPADAEPGRWVFIDGAQNTRDIGGYATRAGHAVRRGLVYRSGTLSHVSDAGCDTFRDLDIVTVVDYRNRLSPLPLYNGDVLCIHQAAEVHGFPVSFRKEGPRPQRYVQGFCENASAFRRTFELLAEPERLPLLYHCAAGTDRTGVMTALLLTLLGVERDNVLADFRLSEQVGSPGNLPAMQKLLDEIEAAGGIETFLAGIGVPSEIQMRVRENLLE